MVYNKKRNMEEKKTGRKFIYGVIALLAFALFCGFLFYIRIEIQKSIFTSVQGSLRLREVADLRHKTIYKKIQKWIHDSEETTLIFMGDIMLSRGVDLKMRRIGDYTFPFFYIASTTRMADVAFGNLEGPISARGKNQGSEYSFRANLRVIEGLVFAGFDVLSLANNHIWDWGSDALSDTIDILKENAIVSVGAGRNAEEANRPAIIMKGDRRIIFFAYTNLYPPSLYAEGDRPGVSDFKEEKIAEYIRNETTHSDIVVVSMHWGNEYESLANEEQKRISRALIDAGADIIVGHHPHVSQEIERYKEGWIAYSLGNFVFDQNFSEETMKGIVLHASARRGIVEKMDVKEIKINKDFQPAFLE